MSHDFRWAGFGPFWSHEGPFRTIFEILDFGRNLGPGHLGTGRQLWSIFPEKVSMPPSHIDPLISTPMPEKCPRCCQPLQFELAPAPAGVTHPDLT